MPSELKLQVAGSTGTPYEVLFVHEDGEVLAYCNCKAGTNGQHCKHRVSILAGDSSSVVGGDSDHISLLQEWLPGSSLASALEELRVAEEAAQQAKARFSKAKKALARAMRG